jgi:carbon starvation protein
MFEALFILTTIDTGTRVARFMLGEFLGRVYKPLERPDWMPGAVVTSALIVGGWAYFIRTGSISTIWPMFGIANQLLAAIALCVGTTVIMNAGRAKYAWVTITPLAFVATTTLTAGYLSIRDNFLVEAAKPETMFRGYLNTTLTAIMMTCMVIVLLDSILHWRKVMRGVPVVEPVIETGD